MIERSFLSWSIILAWVLTAFSPHQASAETNAAEAAALPSVDEQTTAPDKGAPALSPDLLKRPNYRRFNVRLAGGASFALRSDLEDRGLGEYGGQGLIGVDWVLKDPLAFSVLVGYSAFSQGDTGALQDLFATVGFMLRLFPDNNGALGEKNGNALGQLFLDAHFGYHNYEREDRAGYNIGFGYEFSLSKDFNFGPYFRFAHAPIGDGFAYMSASFGIQASVGGKFEPDDVDNDGTEDGNDACPLIAEDFDGFEDDDGCPDEDNDKDGVLDTQDNCPNIAGVASNMGCEENDNDHDGIVNLKDKCPDEAEDVDKFEDKDGCPDPDNDNDGVLDADDRCPGNAEDKDGFEDADGCPDKDNDKDGIADEKDKCPMLPETVNELDDGDGCPDFVKLTGERIVLKDSVNFAKTKPVIQDSSKPMLDEAAALLRLKPELKVRIEGHTDNTTPKKASLNKSQQRADAVKAYLVAAGIEASRLTAEGKGREHPLTDNKTKAAKAENNRIELHLLKTAPANAPKAEETPKAEAPEAEAPKSADTPKGEAPKVD